MVHEKVRSLIRDVPDFPRPGIVFKDLTPLLLNPGVSKDLVEEIRLHFSGIKIDAVACLESRGFWFGMLIAQAFNAPFIPIRKKGKLPYSSLSCNYSLEYGEECAEMHTDAIQKNWNVLIHDDVLATGGTAIAAAELILQAGGKVAGFAFILALGFLKGNDRLLKYTSNIQTIVTY
jgi:adenine phosphoribosyltransferase